MLLSRKLLQDRTGLFHRLRLGQDTVLQGKHLVTADHHAPGHLQRHLAGLCLGQGPGDIDGAHPFLDQPGEDRRFINAGRGHVESDAGILQQLAPDGRARGKDQRIGHVENSGGK